MLDGPAALCRDACVCRAGGLITACDALMQAALTYATGSMFVTLMRKPCAPCMRQAFGFASPLVQQLLSRSAPVGLPLPRRQEAAGKGAAAAVRAADRSRADAGITAAALAQARPAPGDRPALSRVPVAPAMF